MLDRLKGHPAEKALSFQLLRSLKQATYDVVNIGHFGLASTDYLHFTSPIRRYPDLVVHRLLKDRLAAMNRPAGGFKPGATTTDRLALQKMAADSSFAERQAMEVEREVIDLYRAFFLRDRIGDVFDGIISGVTGFGVFVTVDDPFVEGLVRIDALSDDYYNYDESRGAPGRPPFGQGVRAGRQRAGRGAVGQRRAAQDRLRAGGSRPAPSGGCATAPAANAASAAASAPSRRAAGSRGRARAEGRRARTRSNRGPRQSEKKGTPMTIREKLEEDEERVLSRFAQKSRDSKGRDRPEPPDPVRPIFQHDRDRVIHSKAFRRLAGKTQVFLAPEGDHYRTRITHTLEVAQIARTVTRALGLNESLTEAIVMGHDLGHTPFGHAGEKVLAKLMPGGFHHVKQSMRVVEVLENEGQGLNLSVEVRDGILKHSKGKGHVISDNPNLMAMTLEGQIVRIADIVAYVNHDLDDAVRGKVVDPAAVPDTILAILGRTHSERISRMVNDIVSASNLEEKRQIRMTDQVLDALIALRDFLYETVYERPMIRGEFEKAQRIISELWAYFHAHPGRVPGASLAERDSGIRRPVARRRRLHHRNDRPLRAARLRGVLSPAPLGGLLNPVSSRFRDATPRSYIRYASAKPPVYGLRRSLSLSPTVGELF